MINQLPKGVGIAKNFTIVASSLILVFAVFASLYSLTTLSITIPLMCLAVTGIVASVRLSFGYSSRRVWWALMVHWFSLMVLWSLPFFTVPQIYVYVAKASFFFVYIGPFLYALFCFLYFLTKSPRKFFKVKSGKEESMEKG
jgi:hypothetical protein